MSGIPGVSREPLTAADRKAFELALTLQDPEKKALYEQLIQDRWAGWLGEKSTAAGFPELKSDRARKNMALLLENQLRFQRSKEIAVRNGKITLTQDTTTADEALPTKFALAIVRRVYALMQDADWGVTQPLPGPSGYVFYLDFIREGDSTNVLSTEYNYALTAELGVPPKFKLDLVRQLVQAVKQLMGVTFSLEAEEDAKAQLGLDIEQELIGEATTEFARNIYGRQLKDLYTASLTGQAQGTSLPTNFNYTGPNNQHTIPNIGSYTMTDWARAIFNALIDADADYQRVNKRPSNAIICGYGMAARLQRAYTATGASGPTDVNASELGIADYGRFMGRWRLWATEFLPDGAGILYRSNPEPLRAGHIYAPYVPVQVMPAIYGDYDTTTGNYQNKDAWTRNIRERSSEIVVKPYAFQPLVNG